VNKGKTFTCGVCGIEFKARTVHAHPKYCPEHQVEVKRRQRKEWKAKQRHTYDHNPVPVREPRESWLAIIYVIARQCNRNVLTDRAVDIVREKHKGRYFKWADLGEESEMVLDMLTCESCTVREYCPRVERLAVV